MSRVPLALAGALALLYGLPGCSKQAGNLGAVANGDMAALQIPAHPAPVPAVAFADAEGKTHTLAEFKGKVTIVNFWANWCPPCKAEIPSLARLATAESGQPLAIVPISVGKGGDETAGKAFIARNPPLAFYTEPSYRLAYAFAPPIGDIPTTVILDKHGIERGRLAGGADWSSPAAKAVIGKLLAEPG